MAQFQVEDGMMGMRMGMFVSFFEDVTTTTLSDAGVEGNAGLNSASANQDGWVIHFIGSHQ